MSQLHWDQEGDGAWCGATGHIRYAEQPKDVTCDFCVTSRKTHYELCDVQAEKDEQHWTVLCTCGWHKTQSNGSMLEAEAKLHVDACDDTEVTKHVCVVGKALTRGEPPETEEVAYQLTLSVDWEAPHNDNDACEFSRLLEVAFGKACETLGIPNSAVDKTYLERFVTDKDDHADSVTIQEW